MMHTLTSLVVLGRLDVLANVQSFQLETLQSDPAYLQAATEHTMQVAPDLGLTDQQAHAIATGRRVMSVRSMLHSNAGFCCCCCRMPVVPPCHEVTCASH